ncbi:MAG: hypothetical protein AAFZ74_00440 [Pseudomonadota bacterium]
MTYLKSTLSALSLLGLSTPVLAQTSDSPAGQKSAHELLFGDYLSLGAKNSTNLVERTFHDGTSIVFEIGHEAVGTGEFVKGIELTKAPTKVTRLEVNKLALAPRILEKINAFLESNVSGALPHYAAVMCSKWGQPTAEGKWPPCQEIRLKFTAAFADNETFRDPKTNQLVAGEAGYYGACTIFVVVKDRDASIWCHADPQ